MDEWIGRIRSRGFFLSSLDAKRERGREATNARGFVWILTRDVILTFVCF